MINEPFRDNTIFHNFFLQVFCFSLGLIFCPLDPGSVDPHNCVDPNLGSQNVADPYPDPYPEH